jgi:hypothetical protein
MVFRGAQGHVPLSCRAHDNRLWLLPRAAPCGLGSPATGMAMTSSRRGRCCLVTRTCSNRRRDTRRTELAGHRWAGEQ